MGKVKQKALLKNQIKSGKRDRAIIGKPSPHGIDVDIALDIAPVLSESNDIAFNPISALIFPAKKCLHLKSRSSTEISSLINFYSAPKSADLGEKTPEKIVGSSPPQSPHVFPHCSPPAAN